MSLDPGPTISKPSRERRHHRVETDHSQHETGHEGNGHDVSQELHDGMPAQSSISVPLSGSALICILFLTLWNIRVREDLFTHDHTIVFPQDLQNFACIPMGEPQ